MGKLIALIIIILIILGAYLLIRGGNETETPSNEATVTLSDSGFSPQTIRVETGDSIRFMNQSSGGMWVASAPHPTHDIYPAFDQRASVPNGGSWTFIFDRAGSWNYHNHDNASSTGTVIVE